MVDSKAKTLYFDFEKPLEELYQKIEEFKALSSRSQVNLSEEIINMEKRAAELRTHIYQNLTPMQVVQIARHPDRPTTYDYWEKIFDEYLEIKGDRLYGDDLALVAAMAWLNGKPVITVGHQKGRNTKMRLERNFGMAHPEGYRKAMRMMRLAEKNQIPLIFFVDTPGAYPGIGAEERGQAEAIARNLQVMLELTVPVLVVIIGEGASGGALGIGVGNRVAMLENAWYSVISPEGCAAILWKDSSKSATAADILKLTAKDLLEMKVIDGIIPEVSGGAHWDPEFSLLACKDFLIKELESLSKLSKAEIRQQRYQKFRVLGHFQE